ncbi:hypothetical protein EMPS_10940 [Entomortierella parvispora]|uniref:Uncharacterized protein n=1 Tax=Entomortierella parvispora TaxID=205924 RepID=A0A9P3M1H3_9FUNG|nr:hypothetical protein EMPS_10940 [Entomortierella parvispora]
MSATTSSSARSEYLARIHQEMKDLERLGDELFRIMDPPYLGGHDRQETDHLGTTSDQNRTIDWEKLPAHLKFYAAREKEQVWANIVIGYFELRDQLKEFALKEKSSSTKRRKYSKRVRPSNPVERTPEGVDLTPRVYTRYADVGLGAAMATTSTPASTGAASQSSTLKAEKLDGHVTEPKRNLDGKQDLQRSDDRACFIPQLWLWLICVAVATEWFLTWIQQMKDNEILPYKALFRGY